MDHLSVLSFHIKDLFGSVPLFISIPASVVADPDTLLFNNILLSCTSKVCVFRIVSVPSTCRLPVTIKFPSTLDSDGRSTPVPSADIEASPKLMVLPARYMVLNLLSGAPKSNVKSPSGTM